MGSPVGELASGDGRIHLGAGNSSSRCLDGAVQPEMLAGPQALQSQQHWTWLPFPCASETPSPSPASLTVPGQLCLRLVGSGLALCGLRLRWPPDLLCAQSGSLPVRYILEHKVGAALVQPAPPAAARSPSPAGKAGTPTGEEGMGVGGERNEALAWTRGEGAARSPTGVGLRSSPGAGDS